MTTCQWMQMIYSCGRVTSILSWRRATYPGGEPRIKMGESTPALPEPCAHLLYTHAKSCGIIPLLSILIRNCSSHTKRNMLSLQVLLRGQLYTWLPLWACRVWPTCCRAHVINATCAEATHFTGLAMHWQHDSLWGRGILYTSIQDWFWAQGYRASKSFSHPGWEVLDDLSRCLLYRQEGYIPSNYVTEAEDSIEMYEWVCLCS